MALNHLSVTYLQRAGYVEDAGYECCRGIETIECFLETILEIKRDDTVQNRLGLNIDDNSANLQELIKFLVTRAVARVNKACGFFAVNRINRRKHEVLEETGFISSRVYIAALKLCATTLKLAVAFNNENVLEALRMVFRKPTETRKKYDIEKGKGWVFSLSNDICYGDLTMQNLIHQLCEEHHLEDVETHKIEQLFKPGLYNSSDEKHDIVSVLSIFNELIIKILNTERYPIINRLTLLNLSVNIDVFLAETDEKNSFCEFEGVSDKLKLLLELEEKFDSPNHFMPLYPVYSCYFYARLLMVSAKTMILEVGELMPSGELIRKIGVHCYATKEISEAISKACNFIVELKCLNSDAGQLIGKAGGLISEISLKGLNNVVCKKQIENLKVSFEKIKSALKLLQTAEYYFRQSREHLYKNEQMFTQRHEYYKSIRDLYYLYDDFNDRYIHQVRAIQMMKSDVSFCVSKRIKHNLRVLNSLK